MVRRKKAVVVLNRIGGIDGGVGQVMFVSCPRAALPPRLMPKHSCPTFALQLAQRPSVSSSFCASRDAKYY